MYIGTMTPRPPKMHSVAVQCNLLAVPPLQKLESVVSEASTESVTSDPEHEDTDLDTSFKIIQDDIPTE